MANIAYIRVSTKEQNTGRQHNDFSVKGITIDKVYEEKVSGKNANRPQLKAMLDYVRSGDTVYVESYSRLARNTGDLLNIVNYLHDKGVNFVSLKDNIDTTTPQGRLVFTIFAGLAQFERENILERQREGISIAKKKGVYKGRKPITFTDKEFSAAYEEYLSRKITKTALAEKLNITRPTLDKILREKGLI